MSNNELELKLNFIIESEDLLENAERAFLRLDKERDNYILLNEIFRITHNLKGISKAAGIDQLLEITHVAESLILNLKNGALELSDSVVSTLLDFKDKIKIMIECLKKDLNAIFDNSEILNKIERHLEGKIPVPEIINQTVDLEDAMAAADNDTIWEQIEDAEQSSKVIEEEVNQIEKIEVESTVFKAVEHDKVKGTQTDSEESIRVKLSRIDKINDVIGELIIFQTVISQRRFEYIKDDLSNKSIGMIGKLFKELQEMAMSMRLLPLRPTFQKMARIVRDTSKLLGKEVDLHLYGEETGVDKTILEKVADPLVHIVRNAIDHGLEHSDERESKGKNRKGNIEINAFHEGNSLVLKISDDGKGVNPEIIRKKAVEKNIINSDSKLSDHEIIYLIFHPGFSTKEEVSEVSGRGVGLDVVKSNIEKLGGDVDFISELGKGSTVKITLPLTLAIIEGFVIRAENEKFVIPLTQIFEILQLKADEVDIFSGFGNLFKLRGEVLPLFFINHKLGKKVESNLKSLTVIIVRSLKNPYGVVVDDVINQQQIVIKKLGKDLSGTQGVIGSSIMIDGMPCLVLDLIELFKNDMNSNRIEQRLKSNN